MTIHEVNVILNQKHQHLQVNHQTVQIIRYQYAGLCQLIAVQVESGPTIFQETKVSTYFTLPYIMKSVSRGLGCTVGYGLASSIRYWDFELFKE